MKQHPRPGSTPRDFWSRWRGVVPAWCGLALLAAGLGSRVTAAPGAPHWAFQPIQNPPPPAVRDTAWPRTDLDAFILQPLEAAGRHPTAPADKRALIRRATFDLTGLPPEPADIDAFLADDSSAAFSRVIDRLLSSPHYGEHWARHWLDVVRYADTAGETADYPVPTAWHYRNYVIDAFNVDKPYDMFLREQIAGDILAADAPRERYAECVTATGYLAVSRRFGFDSENYHHLTIQDTIDNLGQTVLGLSLGCARCHDHKYDPIPTTDYYALYGIFESSRYAFPGSEQKQKYRSMVSLEPPAEAQMAWNRFDGRLGTLLRKLERNQQSVASAVLRSLTDMDGDFEMQAAAAGGSRGVLVSPWIYDGPIAITGEAQSPFRNLFPSGKVGASLAAGSPAYWFGQSIYPRRSHTEGGVIHVNFDVRLGREGATNTGAHRIWLGSRIVPATGTSTVSPAVELVLLPDTLQITGTNGGRTDIGRVPTGVWHNVQLALDLGRRTLTGRITDAHGTQPLPEQPLLPGWNGSLDYVGVESLAGQSAPMPGLELDNLAVRPTEIPAPNLPTGPTPKSEPTIAALTAELQLATGIDGDLELQTADTAPTKPWNPGPNSSVRIASAAQSPYRNIYGSGTVGLHLPGGAVYQGFGQTLGTPWKAAKTETLHVSFDVRCGASDGAGSWRYYLGHGPGGSPAIELFFNSREFFQRSGDVRTSIQPLQPQQWYQIQLSLDLRGKTYTGTIATPTSQTRFSGALATGWDGVINYTFIDSYGHIGGARPDVDSDNFAVGTAPYAALDATAPPVTEAPRERLVLVQALRRELAALQAELDQARQELNAALVSGPSELTYAVVEGTPRNSRVQLRGEPDKLGAEVPRGFLQILGGDKLPASARGSGRRELAEWLTRPENPLTARVMANRIWQYHFGRGLVATPNDFGIRGQRPTHPELLDHLATQFRQRGWSIKAMHRLIMNSATYQQSAVSGDAATTPLYAGFNRRRLEAEALRDAILLISGDLDRTPGKAHAFPASTSWGYTQHGPFNATYDHQQRSIYLMTPRLKRHPFLALFDGADPNGSTPTRSQSTVPTQALYFMNDPFVHAKSQDLAVRLQKITGTPAEQIALAYAWALGRPPRDVEQAEAAEFLAAYQAELAPTPPATAKVTALAAFARSLLGSNEFVHVD